MPPNYADTAYFADSLRFQSFFPKLVAEPTSFTLILTLVIQHGTVLTSGLLLAPTATITKEFSGSR